MDRADDSRQNAKHAAFRTRRHEPRRRRFGIEAAIARAIGHAENRCLPFETEYGAVNIGLAKQNAGVIHKIASRKIVRAIDDDVVVLEQLERIRAGQSRFDGLDLNVRIKIRKPRAGCLALGLAHVAGAKRNLPLKIGEIHDVEINEAQLAHTRRREIQTERRTEPARADEQNLGVFQLELPLHADFGHDQMAAIAQNLFFRKRRSRLCSGLRLSGCSHCNFLPFWIPSE